jgi:hypothetical protein
MGVIMNEIIIIKLGYILRKINDYVLNNLTELENTIGKEAINDIHKHLGLMGECFSDFSSSSSQFSFGLYIADFEDSIELIIEPIIERKFDRPKEQEISPQEIKAGADDSTLITLLDPIHSYIIDLKSLLDID